MKKILSIALFVLLLTGAKNKVNAQCTTDFAVIPDTVYNDYWYYLYATSPLYQNVQSYSWTVDGNTVANTNYLIYRMLPGTHQVCLTTITNNSCTSSTCKTITTYGSCGLNVSFTFSQLPLHNNIVTFTPSAIQPGLTYKWSFGDGTFSTQQSPTHTYGNYSYPLTYQVKLTVFGNNCQDSSQHQGVTVYYTCDANFTATVNQSAVTFIAAASHYYSNWNFGDGNSALGDNVTHTYAQAGTYSVMHIVHDSIGTCADSMYQNVTVTSAPPTCSTDFDVTPDTVYYDYWYYFRATQATIQNAQTYSWTVDGGSPLSTGIGLYWRITPGTHQVCLTTTTVSGCTSSKCKTIVAEPICNMNASFTATHNAVNNRQVSFTPSPIQAGLIYHWDFGDYSPTSQSNQQSPTHTYAQPGTYSVKLTVRTNNCRDTIRQNVFIDTCTALFTYTLDSHGDAVFYSASPQTQVSQTWHLISLLDSTLHVTLTGPSPSYSFPDTGYYYLCLDVLTTTGCVAHHCDYIYVNHVGARSARYVSSYPNPVTGSTVQFKVSSVSATTMQYKIYNLQGVMVYQSEHPVGVGLNIITVPVQQLQRGQYFVDITCGDQRKRSIFQKL